MNHKTAHQGQTNFCDPFSSAFARSWMKRDEHVQQLSDGPDGASTAGLFLVWVHAVSCPKVM